MRAAIVAGLVSQVVGSWKELPVVEPTGERSHTGSYVVADRKAVEWTRPAVRYDPRVASGRKRAKVVVLIYDPILKSRGGVRLVEWLKGTDPEEASRILADVVREASWGYITYEIVDVIRLDAFPRKVDGFRYDEASYLAAREAQRWQPSPASYRAMFTETGLLDRFRQEGITELWVWGADGFHLDEFAGYIPNRYGRFGPTDNPWLYRPYDIPEELGRTTWVMGFNVEVGVDNALHSYNHRVESMAALAVGEGIWDSWARDDPWNVFSRVELDRPGRASQVGNVHVPPNGQQGYDYGNPRRVESFAWNWWRYPDVRGPARSISAAAWGGNAFGYQKWWMERLPKGPGATRYGYNNWWVYVANTDEDLADWEPHDLDRFEAP
ncbi:MAG: hypothetical protein KatS3mg108_3019 [Isosphaeraceae bacterium]|nr:MAG: hypothetical protein KatS3mg108_3019 [Isosphaeraceae bacterium]